MKCSVTFDGLTGKEIYQLDPSIPAYIIGRDIPTHGPGPNGEILPTGSCIRVPDSDSYTDVVEDHAMISRYQDGWFFQPLCTDESTDDQVVLTRVSVNGEVIDLGMHGKQLSDLDEIKAGDSFSMTYREYPD